MKLYQAALEAGVAINPGPEWSTDKAHAGAACGCASPARPRARSAKASPCSPTSAAANSACRRGSPTSRAVPSCMRKARSVPCPCGPSLSSLGNTRGHARLCFVMEQLCRPDDPAPSRTRPSTRRIGQQDLHQARLRCAATSVRCSISSRPRPRTRSARPRCSSCASSRLQRALAGERGGVRARRRRGGRGRRAPGRLARDPAPARDRAVEAEKARVRSRSQVRAGAIDAVGVNLMAHVVLSATSSSITALCCSAGPMFAECGRVCPRAGALPCVRSTARRVPTSGSACSGCRRTPLTSC